MYVNWWANVIISCFETGMNRLVKMKSSYKIDITVREKPRRHEKFHCGTQKIFPSTLSRDSNYVSLIEELLVFPDPFFFFFFWYLSIKIWNNNWFLSSLCGFYSWKRRKKIKLFTFLITFGSLDLRNDFSCIVFTKIFAVIMPCHSILF